ncbi:transglycosylase SLT domain-containing protein [bacterium]|nr:transglycosylase SLT domain-containing protein [bacterium]
MFRFWIIIILLVCVTILPIMAGVTVHVPEKLTFCEEEIPLELSDVRERLLTQLMIFSKKKVQMTLWWMRKDRFFPTIEKILKKRHLPEDLKYICVIESSLIQRARSSRNAYGLWQFMAPTARENGLNVSGNIDERLHLEKATDAAFDYLEKMKNEFGSWAIALAGYNAGHGRIKHEIYRQGTSNYYEIELPDETERYLFNAISTKLILENPELYGFDFSNIKPFPVMDYEEVLVKLDNFIPVKMLAYCADLPFRDFSRMNPWIKGVNLEKGTYKLHIPTDRKKQFNRRMKNYFKKLIGYSSLGNGLKVIVSTETAHMRMGPGMEYPSFRILIKGDKFRVKGRTGHRENGHYWYIFKLNDGSSGWIWGAEINR